MRVEDPVDGRDKMLVIAGRKVKRRTQRLSSTCLFNPFKEIQQNYSQIISR